MSLTSKKTTDMSTSSASKAAMRARVAGTAAAANAAVAAQNAASMAQAAAQNAAVLAAGAAQNASSAASRGVKQGVYTARSWAAPRLDSAAEYCTTTIAPNVSAALHSTARKVEPRSSKRSILTWSLLGGAIFAALGAAAAMVRYRYREAIAADSEPADEEVLGDSTGSQAASTSPDAASPTATTPKDPKKASKDETSANGRVTSSGW